MRGTVRTRSASRRLTGSRTHDLSHANPEPLWAPDPDRIAAARITRFQAWAAERHGAPADGGYAALHRWSVDELDTFWQAVADWFDVRFTTPYERVLADRSMPGARWFPGATLNYAEHALRAAEDPARADDPALLYVDETHEPTPVTWAELRRQVGSLAAELRALGVRPGDRVSGYLPNIPEAVVALLATAAVGGVWTSCAPDFGARSVLDRFQQVEPVVLFTVDGYRYGGKEHDRRDDRRRTARRAPHPARRRPHPAARHARPPRAPSTGPPSPPATPSPSSSRCPSTTRCGSSTPPARPACPRPSSSPRAASSSNTSSSCGLHCDLGPEDRFFWYTSTGWMMWNFLVSGLLTGTTVVLYDGSPGYPDTGAQWRIAERTGATLLRHLRRLRHGLPQGRGPPLPRLRPLRREVRGHHRLPAPARRLPLAPRRGGRGPLDRLRQRRHRRLQLLRRRRTHPPRPHRRAPGRLPRHRPPVLGPVTASPVIGEVGELVVTNPMPSMPIHFWNDPDGSRYRDSYFEMFPGVWRHGDWITITDHGSVVIHGRSDSTLNRQGVRMGSADIYEAVERLPEIRESLVIGLEEPNGGYWMPLFVHLADGATLDDDLRARIKRDDPRGALPAPRPRRDHRGPRHPAHPDRQAHRGPGQAAPPGRPAGQGGQPGLRRQPRTPPLLRGAGPHPRLRPLSVADDYSE